MGGERADGAAARAEEHVRRAILTGRYPVGGRVSAGEVARALGIGVRPARVALRALAADGLLERRRPGRLVVRGFATRHRQEILEIREALEEISVRHAARRVTPAEVDELRTLVAGQRRAAQAGDDPRFVELDERFHLALARASELELVQRLLGQMRGFVRMMRVDSARPGDVLLRVAAEHDAIVDALEQCDEEGAAVALRAHLRTADYRRLVGEDG